MFCNYHPLETAELQCPQCQNPLCQHCSDEGEYGRDTRCFLCREVLEPCAYSAKDDSVDQDIETLLRYPHAVPALPVIAVTALLSTLFSYAPLGWLWQLLPLSLVTAYAGSCLRSSAAGENHPPAFVESVNLLFPPHGLALLPLASLALVLTAQQWIGSSASLALGLLLALVTPPAMMLYNTSEQLTEALKPRALVGLMALCRAEYGLLLLALLLATACITLFHTAIAPLSGALFTFSQWLTIGYFTVLCSHYLGLVQRRHRTVLQTLLQPKYRPATSPRSHIQRKLAEMAILLREGEWLRLDNLIAKSLASSAKELEFMTAALHYTLQRAQSCDNSRKRLRPIAKQTLTLLANANRNAQLLDEYQRLCAAIPDYRLNDAALRYRLAQLYHHRGDTRAAVRLLSGLYALDPNFPQLLPAYRLLESALDSLPGAHQQAEKCRQMIARLEQLNGRDQQAPNANCR